MYPWIKIWRMTESKGLPLWHLTLCCSRLRPWHWIPHLRGSSSCYCSAVCANAGWWQVIGTRGSSWPGTSHSFHSLSVPSIIIVVALSWGLCRDGVADPSRSLMLRRQIRSRATVSRFLRSYFMSGEEVQRSLFWDKIMNDLQKMGKLIRTLTLRWNSSS